MSKVQRIVKLSEKDHILKRPGMYLGSIACENHDVFILNETLQQKSLSYTPALLKIFDEVLDNAIDVIFKTKVGDTIKIDISDSCKIQDNSTGFPLKHKDDEEEPLFLALANARAGSNFADENEGQIGTNGVGAFLTNVFSSKFEATSTTSTKTGFVKVKAKWKNNAELVKIQSDEVSNGHTGTTVEFVPDWSKFTEKSFTPELLQIIETRLNLLAYLYDIKFVLNGKRIKPAKKLADLFGDRPFLQYKTKDYELLVIAHDKKVANFSMCNGLVNNEGGSHIDTIFNDLFKLTQESKSLSKLTKNDLTNTFQIVFVGQKFLNLKFNSQTKEKITNSVKEVREYLGDLDPFLTKVLKNKEFKSYLEASAKARELRANKSQLDKVKKQKIKSDKYFDAQQNRTNLIISEGFSAIGGLLPSLGRENNAYYALKGKLLNVLNASKAKALANQEIAELVSILHNTDFEKVIIATDQDLDGFSIRGLCTVFIKECLPEYLDKLYFLQTPIIGAMKNSEIQRWIYNLDDKLELQKGETSYYFKGLGSWETSDLKKVIKVDGLDKMVVKVQVDPTSTLVDKWFRQEFSDDRKQMILENEFDIAKA